MTDHSGFSRRRFLGLGAGLGALAGLAPLAGSAALAGPTLTGPGLAGPAAGPANVDLAAAYQELFWSRIAQDPRVRLHRSGEASFLYRPGELLVAESDIRRVVAALARNAAPEYREGLAFGGMRRLVFGPDTDIPALVSQLRSATEWARDGVPTVQPHHVGVGFPNIMGNPEAPPRLGLPLGDPGSVGQDVGSGVLVAVCDTGIWRDAPIVHHTWFGGEYQFTEADEDLLVDASGQLGAQAGHGTFVTGVLRQTAPAVALEPKVVLDPSGLGDEETLVAALQSLSFKVRVVNLSLGMYTQDDLPSFPLAGALEALAGSTADPADAPVVVAAAGNSASSRPSWPAAFDSVIAVAAVIDGIAGASPAPYSNFGPWVDVCAVGDWSSTYVPGELLLPGTDSLVFDGYARWSGTSFAAPLVAGKLAQRLSRGGTTSEAVTELLAGSELAGQPGYGVYLPR